MHIPLSASVRRIEEATGLLGTPEKAQGHGLPEGVFCPLQSSSDWPQVLQFGFPGLLLSQSPVCTQI